MRPEASFSEDHVEQGFLLRWFVGHGDSKPSLGCQPGMKNVYTWGCHGEVGRWDRFSDKEVSP